MAKPCEAPPGRSDLPRRLEVVIRRPEPKGWQRHICRHQEQDKPSNRDGRAYAAVGSSRQNALA
eukprot:4061647-Alexandrium_andersonii.AAC.1